MASGIVSPLVKASQVNDDQFDCVVVVTDDVGKLSGNLSTVQETLDQYTKLDKSGEVSVVACPALPSGKLVYAPTGPVSRDYDDVRTFQETAVKALKRAVASGSRSPLLVPVQHDRFPLSARVTALGALHALYTPIEVREGVPEKASKVNKLGLLLPAAVENEKTVLEALETGRLVYRDIGGSDPERMAPPGVKQYVQDNFKDTCIKVNVLADPQELEKKYPLLMAVNRAARNVKRHAPCVIYLEYEGEGPVDQTLLLVGKGITYDTGGADLKVGGVMAGMHRDKCGSAFVAGFFQTLSILKPKGLKVLGAMCMVRNSIGSESYVSDEIITSRAGVRVRIGNTDAEGRMAMCDVLCDMKERAANEVNPSLFTIATLTGHVIRAFGDNYTGVLGNGPSVSARVPQTLFDAGALSGDPFEISTLRREDYVFHKGPSEYEDVIQANTKPSTMTNRGHQSPMAFLTVASGLDKHGNDSSSPLPYTHLDIAGSSGPFPGVPTGAPIVAFSHAYVLNRQLSSQ